MSNYGNDKIVDIRSAKRSSDERTGKRGRNKKISPEFIGVIIFAFVFIYMIIYAFFLSNKDHVPIYEVQAEEENTQQTYKGIALRDESIISCDYSGNINYYVQNGKKTAKNGIVYSIDEGSTRSGEITSLSGIDRLADNDIKSIKNVIYGYLDDYSDFRLNEVNEFKNEISDTIYSLVNDNSIENMKKIGADSSNSAFHIKRTDVAGVISYKTDSVCGLGFDDLKPEMFQDSYDFKTKNIKSTGLVGQGEPVCRIVTDDNWKIAVKIPEELYVRFIERDSISLYINDYYVPVTGSVQTLQRDSDYYVLISIDKYMSMYIDHRVLDIKFVMNDETGLKIPVSSKVDKAFYIVPMSVFVEDESYRANMLLRECSDKEGGFMYEQVYIDKFFTDNTYAYVDTKYLNDGDVLVNNETGERYSVHATGTIEGVFNVNKGFNQFVRIEKIRANGEYIIIRNNTPDGLRIYDHIALNAKDAQDLAIIY